MELEGPSCMLVALARAEGYKTAVQAEPVVSIQTWRRQWSAKGEQKIRDRKGFVAPHCRSHHDSEHGARTATIDIQLLFSNKSFPYRGAV